MGDLITTRRATLLLDQADHMPDELLQVLVDSYKAGAKRVVVNMEERGQPHEFDVFAPKAFASHQPPDTDLLDRCIQIPTMPNLRRIEPFFARDGRLEETRSSIYRFALINHRRLFALPSFRDDASAAQLVGLQGRAWELWWPLRSRLSGSTCLRKIERQRGPSFVIPCVRPKLSCLQ